MNDEVIDLLWDLGFIGFFPGNLEVLLVSIPIALGDVNYDRDVKLTKSEFLSILKAHEIFIFNSPEDWLKYKNPELALKRRRKRF